MAEVVGLVSGAVTLAGLFKLCIKAFDVIQAGRHQEVDIKKLVLRLNIEKCRLYTWGQSMGLTEASGEVQRPIDVLPFQNLVQDTLEIILQIFHNSSKIEERYGCEVTLDQGSASASHTNSGSPSATDRLASSFGNFRVRSGPEDVPSLSKRTRWAVRDRKKFLSLIREVQILVNGLQEITEPLIAARRQESAMKNAILTITDIETLNMVADVCERDHRRIADAASLRSETLSALSAQNETITAWTQAVEQPDEDDITIAQIEGMGVAELKHLLAKMMASEGSRATLEALLHVQNDVEVAAKRAALKAEMNAVYKLSTGQQGAIRIVGSTDRRDAIMIFTVVSLIFIPMSFLSVMFGANIIG